MGAGLPPSSDPATELSVPQPPAERRESGHLGSVGQGDRGTDTLEVVLGRQIGDRIVVDGVIHTGDVLQLAFTQRLARALVAELVRQVSVRTNNPLMHDFAQDEAISTKPQSDAVQVAGDRPAWLVTYAHFHAIDAGVRVIFTEDDKRAVHLDCAEAVLRNLIDIFHKLFLAAEWDTNVFPGWVVSQAGTAPQSQIIN